MRCWAARRVADDQEGTDRVVGASEVVHRTPHDSVDGRATRELDVGAHGQVRDRRDRQGPTHTEGEAMNTRIRPLELAVIVCGAWGPLAGPVSLVVWLMGGK